MSRLSEGIAKIWIRLGVGGRKIRMHCRAKCQEDSLSVLLSVLFPKLKENCMERF